MGNVRSRNPRRPSMDRSTVNAISYPFELDVFGVVKTTDNQTKIYTDRLVTLLSTTAGERPMRPGYGTNVASALFENENDFKKAVNIEIRGAVQSWIPELTIQKIQVLNISEDGKANVEVSVVLPDFTSTTIRVSSATLNPNGTVSI